MKLTLYIVSEHQQGLMRLIEHWRGLWRNKEVESEVEPPLGTDEDPFDEPVVMEIRDVIDLHAIPPKQVKAVVEEYLIGARAALFLRPHHSRQGHRRAARDGSEDFRPCAVRHSLLRRAARSRGAGRDNRRA